MFGVRLAIARLHYGAESQGSLPLWQKSEEVNQILAPLWMLAVSKRASWIEYCKPGVKMNGLRADHSPPNPPPEKGLIKNGIGVRLRRFHVLQREVKWVFYGSLVINYEIKKFSFQLCKRCFPCLLCLLLRADYLNWFFFSLLSNKLISYCELMTSA